MTFEEALPILKDGGIIARNAWDSHTVIIKQNNNVVYPDIFPKMTSLPEEAKALFRERNMEQIKYTNQVIILNTHTGVAKNYIPDWEDLFATDWNHIILRDYDRRFYH